MAMAKPPRLIVLMVSPNALSVRIAATNAKGMVTSEMMVVRTFMRNTKSTMTTKMAPSMRERFTLSMELLMKRSWRYTSVVSTTSEGSSRLISSSVASSFFVSSSVLVLGCLVTVRMTAGSVRNEATPNLGRWSPTLTSAMSESLIGFPNCELKIEN